MIQQIFSIVSPLFFIVGVGYFYGARVRPEMRITNQLIMDVFIPALILSVMLGDGFHVSDYVALMLGGTLVMFLSGVLAYFFAKLVGFSWRSFVPPAMFSNWANLGVPLYVFSLGDAALGGGIMLVAVGNVLCFTVGTYIHSGKLSSLDALRTPVIIAVIIGCVFNFIDLAIPEVIITPIDMLGRVAIPLMLFSLGVRLTHVSWSDSTVGLTMAVFCPLVGVCLAVLLCQILPLSELHQNILILFGVLPPAVVNFMLADHYNNEPEKVASMVLIANLLSVISIPLVLYFVL